MTESQYTKILREDFKSKGWLTYKISQRFSSGFPDFIAIKDGQVLFCEVKVNGNKLTSLQTLTMRAIEYHGGEIRIFSINKKKEELTIDTLDIRKLNEVKGRRIE